jgi:hypothetical protein
MITFTDLANQYRISVEQQDSPKMLICIIAATEYLSKAIDQTTNASLTFDETQKSTILRFMSLKGVNEKTAPELYDLVTLLNVLHNQAFNISVFAHFMNEIRAYIRSSADAGEFGGMSTSDDTYAVGLINSFYRAFKLPPDTNLAMIWTPDYSFLRKQQKDLRMPSTLGKNHEQRSLAFKPSAMLFMSASFWHNDSATHYFSCEQKKLFKVRTTDTPFVLKRNFDEKSMPKGCFLYALSMHGGLIAAQLSDLKGITARGVSLLKHSTFRAGQNLFAPGELLVDEYGMVTAMNGNSGHYLTPDENLIEAAFYLLDKGYIRETCWLKLRDKKIESISLKELLENGSLRFDSENVQRIVDERREKHAQNQKKLKCA